MRFRVFLFVTALLASGIAVLGPAAADQVRVGHSNLYVDLPFATLKDSKITSEGPSGGAISQSYVASFWSEEWGRLLGFVAIIPRDYAYFKGDTEPLEKDIANWSFFDGKQVTDKKSVACAFGSCLGFRAEDFACAVFRRQIGSTGKARTDSRSDTMGPRLYGFYCSYTTDALSSSEIDAVLQGISEQ
jgi:hypothetical protein